MLIEPLLGYKSTWRILELLFETPRKPVSRKDLFKFTKLGNAPLSRGLERLASVGVITKEKHERKEKYYINEMNEYARAFQELWKKEQTDLRNLSYDIRTISSEFVRGLNENCRGVSKIILFGSHAKGTASIHSDIDFAVVFSKDLVQEIEVTRIVHKLEKQFNVKIQVHYFTEKSFLGKNKLVKEIKNDGIKLV
jgi:predicted nucleotidyltransferase